MTYLTKRQRCYRLETSQLICSANQSTGFNIITILALNELISKVFFQYTISETKPEK